MHLASHARKLLQLIRKQALSAASALGLRRLRLYHRRRAVELTPSIKDALSLVDSHGATSTPESCETPVFIFSSSWRSGSTLLQRLICSERNVIIWGEPYAHCAYIQAMSRSIQAFNRKYPSRDFYFTDPSIPDLASAWIANLYPPAADLKASHVAFFDRLYAEPARRAGAAHWGIKEVRLAIDHARYLKWLYPQAKFLFLYRNVYDAFRSYKGHVWYLSWPSEPVPGPYHFARLWARLTEDYMHHAASLGGILIPYEELVTGKVNLGVVSSYLGVNLDPGILDKRVSGAKTKPRPLSRTDIHAIRYGAGRIARSLGFQPPKT